MTKIYNEIYPNKPIEWVRNDTGSFTQSDAEILRELSKKQGIQPELVMKLLDAELSVSGIGNRRGIIKKITSILNQDWGTLDEIIENNTKLTRINPREEQLQELKIEYERIN